MPSWGHINIISISSSNIIIIVIIINSSSSSSSSSSSRSRSNRSSSSSSSSSSRSSRSRSSSSSSSSSCYTTITIIIIIIIIVIIIILVLLLFILLIWSLYVYLKGHDVPCVGQQSEKVKFPRHLQDYTNFRDGFSFFLRGGVRPSGGCRIFQERGPQFENRANQYFAQCMCVRRGGEGG